MSACCWCPDHKITAGSPVFVAVGAGWHPPLLMRSLEKQEGRHHPTADGFAFSWALLWRGWVLASRVSRVRLSIALYIPHRSMPLLPPRAWPAAFLQTVGRKWRQPPFFLARLIWQCLTPPPKLCSALEHSHTQLCLISCNLAVCAVDPCRIPSVPVLLDFVPSKKSCSGFSELMSVSLTQNCHSWEILTL